MRKRTGHCLGCGYELTGLGGRGRCPECGAAVTDLREAIDPHAVDARRVRLIGVMLAGGLIALAGLWLARTVMSLGE